MIARNRAGGTRAQLLAQSVTLGILLAPALALWACRESPLTPGARVAAVLTSRDSITFEIGDSVLVQAEVRDAMGNNVLEASVDWRSLDPGVATVHPNDRLAQVIATGAGNGAIVASAGSHDATIPLTVLPPITATTLALHADTAWSPGDQRAVGFTSQSPTGPRFGHYTVVSRSNVAAAYLVEAASHEVTISAQQLGETWVVVTERHGSADSLLFVVRQRPARVRISANPFQGFVGRSFALTAQVTDARNNPIAGQTVSWSSLDTAIARVDSNGLVSFRAVDTTAIVATHASGLADTARAFVLPQPTLGLFNLVGGHSHDSLTVGVHELADTFYAYATGGVSPWVHLRVVDTSIATVRDSVRYVGDGGTFQVRGVRPGRTLLIGEAPLMDPDTVRVHVLPSRLAIVDYIETPGFVLLGTDNAHYTAIPLDSAGTPHPLADTLVVTFHSSDSTVLRLASDPFIGTYPPGVPSLPAFSAHAADTGRAVIYATAPGFTGDSMVWRVLARPKLHFTQDRSLVIGAKQLAPDAGLGTIGPIGDTVTATLTNRRPASLTLPGTVTFSCCTAIGLYASVHLDIALPGVDTVIATAPGHEPDTAVITVTTPRFLLPDTLRATTLGGFTEVVAGDSLGTPHPPADSRTLTATSSDTTVVRASSILFPAAFDGWTLLLPAADTTGVATITVSDSAGLYPPKSMTVVVTLDTSLQVIVNDGYEYGAVATGQRFEDSRFLLTHADVGTTPRTVHLATTVPGVLRVPDSIVVTGSGYVYFPGAGGDTPGTTRIVATAHGFRPDTSAPIVVGLGHLVLQAPDTAFVGGTGYTATVTALSPNGVNVLPLDANLAATLVPLDPGIVPQNATVTIPAGQSVSPATPLTITAPGNVRLAVLDQRAVPAPFTGDTVTVVAQPAWLRLSSPTYGPALTVGVGQRLDANIARPGNVVAAPAAVGVTRRGSRTVSASSGLLPAGAAAAPYPIEGRAIGSDTLILAASGYAPDTVEVMVTDGSVEPLNWPALVRAGDSVPILLRAYDATRIPHRVTARTTFTMQTTGGLTFSDGAQTISAISIAADSATTPVFYVKGTAAGAASVWFVNVDYLPRTYQTTVVAQPIASGQRVR